MTGAAPPLPAGLAERVVAWQRQQGRHDLPWQRTRDPYRVWLSEVMLQQTQVVTVLGYYARFLERFPGVAELAAAPLDEVLALWSGLGYYSRARHLHRCAQVVVAEHGGVFPRRAALLQTLPGIGRSTAAAIAAFCFSERVAILDGNVKRVLTRVLGHGADLAQAANERALWDLATALLPEADLDQAMPRYTQGLMDLGATLCRSRQPDCAACPLQTLCVAQREGRPEHYPVKTRRLRRRAESWWWLELRQPDGALWLARRPTPGIWAGLYTPPLFDSAEALAAAVPEPLHAQLQHEPAFVHVLTHRDLHLHPVRLELPAAGAWDPLPGAGEAGGEGGGAAGWFAPGRWAGLGLPAPLRKRLLAG